MNIELDRLLGSLANIRLSCELAKQETTLQAMKIGIDVAISRIDRLTTAMIELAANKGHHYGA